MQSKPHPAWPTLPAALALTALLGCAVVCPLVSAAEYLSNEGLATRLQSLASGRESVLRVRSLIQTAHSNHVWLVEVGRGTTEARLRRPALLLVAGIEGNDLVGSVSAVAWIEQLARGHETNESVRALVDTSTLYVVPRLNPEAAARFFTRPKIESSVNTLPFDDDRDGQVDEDGPDDLNGDGLITAMRVKDAEGDLMLDPADRRLLLKADRAKGEVGAWRVFVEGRDADGDEAWNEDGPGGVNFNRNFPYNYRFFAADAGRHQISEPETRALADFVIAHPNIAVVFTFGAADNLTQTPKAEAPKRPPVALHEDDAGYYRTLGKAWRDALGLKKELPSISESGTFSDWMYFHRGRLSLAARPWSLSAQIELGKPSSKTGEDPPKAGPGEEDKSTARPPEVRNDPPAAKPKGSTGKTQEPEKADSRNEEERAWLKWAEANAPESYVPWTAVEHPDFPGQTVEVGGWAPFARTNPPERLLNDWVARHGKFLTELAGKLPRLGFRSVKIKALGASVFDVTVQLENTGYLPTALAQGELSREVAPTRVEIDLAPSAILSGAKRVMLGSIPGSGGMREVRWVILAPGRAEVSVEAISTLAGTARKTIELKEEKP